LSATVFSITVIDALTAMEKTVADNRRNLSMAEQFRRLYYEEISPKLEECVGEITGYKVKVTSISTNGVKRIDKIVLTVL